MSARDELFTDSAASDPTASLAVLLSESGRENMYDLARVATAAGWVKPRTITTAAELEALPFGSAVQTSDDSDTVVLKAEGVLFRNQTGADLSSTDLWRFGTRPFTVLYEPSGE